MLSRAAAAGAVLKAQGGNCAVLPKNKQQTKKRLPHVAVRRAFCITPDIKFYAVRGSGYLL